MLSAGHTSSFSSNLSSQKEVRAGWNYSVQPTPWLELCMHTIAMSWWLLADILWYLLVFSLMPASYWSQDPPGVDTILNVWYTMYSYIPCRYTNSINLHRAPYTFSLHSEDLERTYNLDVSWVNNRYPSFIQTKTYKIIIQLCINKM